ncbi:MAG: aminopeptidase [Alkalispirochaeta sp.]
MPIATLPYVAWAVPLGLAAVGLLFSCYLPRQGYHLVAQQFATRPISSIPTEARSQEERELFAEVARIRSYAADELGLAVGGSYTTYYETDRDHLVDVVSAAREFSFERKEWWFPVFGRFPYKGFYRRAPAERLARRLDARGWDVIIRPVDAFSTLGYFTDPVISFMAEYTVARLAELITHEAAHSTVWLRGESQFNEEFATFLGRVGAERYITRRYGPDSAELRDLVQRRRDQERFRTDVLALKEQLRELYSAGSDLPENELRTAKRTRIAAFQREYGLHYAERYETKTYRFFSEITVNNAYLDLFDTYSGDIDRFYQFHRQVAGEELPQTIAEILRLTAAWEALPRRDRPDPITLLTR